MIRCWLILFLLGGVTAMANDYRVPLMPQPPKVDGKIEAAEWAAAGGFDGFAMNGQLERRRIRAWVGATPTHLYFAFKSQLPDEGGILAQVNQDTLKLVYDDSIEVWIDPTPGSEHGNTYQMLANALGRQAYKHHGRGNVREQQDWHGNSMRVSASSRFDWQVANGFHDGYWHCEVAVPIENVAPGRKATDGAWGINLCRNWKQEWAFSSLGGGAYAPSDRFTFAADALAITYENRADCTVGDVHGVLVLSNPTPKAVTVKAGLSLKRDLMPEMEQSEAVTLAPGERKELALKTKDESTRKFDLRVSVTSADGQTTHYARSYGWNLGAPWRWTAKKKEVLPVDFQFGYYPYLGKMRVLADVSNLPPDAKLDFLTCMVRRKGATTPVKSVRFDQFVNGKQEQTFDLPLDASLRVESLRPLKGEYEIALSAVGQNVPKGELVKPFERTVYEWERNSLGKSTKVYPPFTPLRVRGRQVSAVLREHEMSDLGLWGQVVSREKPLLAAPMAFRVTSGGQAIEPKVQKLRFTKSEGHQTVAETGFDAGPCRAKLLCAWDYDGLMRVDMTLLPSGGKPVDALTLDIPLKNSAAPLLHAMGDGIRNTLYESVRPGEGVVWTSEKVQANDIPKNFCSYIYVGSPVRGLCWFAENDRGWSWDRTKPNVELARKGDTLTLRVHLINTPLVIAEPRTITFGLLAAPVKPRLADWRYKWNRDKYTLLGTDINWLALGNCGSVYPAHKDMFLWEMIARGNREQLGDADVKKVIEHGRKYFEPYGPEYVERYERHVRHNLRARYGKKMVFYYNRASYQLADEFQTFQDEWCLTDYRTVGPGKGVGEIKIVPSESYIDHALYWYGKSFEVGGNQGVYWDNWFFVGSYNRMMA
ncbi:MAG: hypothetical protein FJ279_22975, partial [Planctomycetes bacterium]|nr:hypothetical protein [Planctomycetota bacterium]